jgi:hypothetical protein
MCSKLLKAAMPEWLPFFESHYGELDRDTREKLLQVSPATIDRILKLTKSKVSKGKSGTKPGKMLRNEIPIRTNFWDVEIPGFVEADTVAHCGGSLEGEFVWSLTLTDICTTWTESRAVWAKGSTGVVEQIQDIESFLPFVLHGFDCDNGSEFLNWHLVRYFADNHAKKRLFSMTRSRPNQKNDNAHVEQKNYTHPRQLLGYQRLEFQQLLPLINDLYRNDFSLFKNHFCPSFKLDKKVLVITRHRRIYGDPITPYQRVLQSDAVSDDKKKELIEIHKKLDPIKLKHKIERKLRKIFNLNKALKTSHKKKFFA